MYLIVFIKEDKKLEPLDLVETDAIASLIINALKNKQHASVVFRGNKENLDLLSQALKQQKWSTGMTEQQIKDRLMSLSSQYSIAPVMYREVSANHIIAQLEFDGYTRIEAAKVLSHLIEEEKRITIGNYEFGYNGKSFFDNSIEVTAVPIPDGVDYSPDFGPGVVTYPKGINPDETVLKIWQFVMKRFKKDIQKQETVAKQWITACLIFQRVCIKKRVNPWIASRKITHSENPEIVREKIVEDDKKADHFIDHLFTRLEAERLASKLGEQRLYNVEQKGDKYEVSFARTLFTPSKVEASEILDYVRNNYAFQKTKDSAKQRLTPMMEVEFHIIGENKLRILTTFGLATNNAQTIAETEETGAILIKKLKLLFNNFFNKGRLKFLKRDLVAADLR